MADNLFSDDKPIDKSYDASSIQVLEDMEHVRLRPGMYIGGTDDRALHHMVAEIIDNSMDEAVAGHATWIEVELHENFHVTVRDNGRGIPVDMHPKFPNKSALEIIFCTLNAGGKFSGENYETSGGLHGVGSSVVNALSDFVRVEVAKNRELFALEFSRGLPQGKLKNLGSVQNRRGTSVTFHPDPEIFGKSLNFKAKRLYAMAKSKAYLFSGVEIRWKVDPKCLEHNDETPITDTFRFPNGLADYLNERLVGSSVYSEIPFAGKVQFSEKFGHSTIGNIEWAINWTPSRDSFTQSYCNTVPTPEGGTHESGFWSAILKGIKSYGELINNKKSASITRDDVMGGGCALVSCFISEPKFVGQTKDRLATTEAIKWVENSVRDHFDNWLASNNKSAGAILDYMVLKAEERLRRKQEKDTARKSATKKLRLPGKLTDCSNNTREGTELFIVEGDSAGGSAKMARDRKTQALLPLRGKILNVLGAASNKMSANNEINDLCQALGVQTGTKFNIDDLRYEKIIIMTDADVDGAHIASLLMTFFFTQMRPLIDNGHLYMACPPLFRLTQGANRVYCMDDIEKNNMIEKGLGGRGRIDISRFKGLGEMDAKDLKETTMNKSTRQLIQINIDEDEPGQTDDLVDRLMGKKPELRFQYIQENAKFVEDLDV
ncbi:DNA topoisomerase IV subunit B [Amylibacter sp.]|nr:DNA topoisomerase IV subunit B [Amylibacter sp.]MDB4017990.1 DNA topoisomerase IV subunit B [Amylibacter sp.]MDB4045574.1 DNA topoisomerase IV subunit B [Amylibacter sp.]MDB4132754.1 DNA topoisomerase IV subunit B [Amylibacter sp.]MDB9766961.1 DNA topoisomerase IV subunit B [Amylibacter sp.]|tara:strand:+ start:1352 stop:3337 length:1986 start_codon:yes stop_codon:yes gene_type:complete